ncbi:MAG: OmpA family protein [Lentisphaeria bacterium]|nr:OmpA family protein [Lentisphaeria bacterium]
MLTAVCLSLVTGCGTKKKLNLGYLHDTPVSPTDARPGTDFPPGAGEFNPLGDGNGTTWQDPKTSITTNAGAGEIKPTKRWEEVVYFAYDSAALGPTERAKLDTLAAHLKEHSTYCLIIEGHCDDRGSDEYNRALGETRALVVRDYLCTLGIETSRMETISYGEEKPAVTQTEGETGHRLNRRAEFVFGFRQ